jgi:hypothetical protein
VKTLSTLDIGDNCEISLLNYLKLTVPPLVLNEALETGGTIMPHLIEDEILSELAGGASAHDGASALHAATGLCSGLASGASHMSRGS